MGESKKIESEVKDISFIILNYNSADTTSDLVDSLLLWEHNDFKMHIIVVDNMSSDNSFMKLRESYGTSSQVDVLQNPKNGGYSYGNNHGVRFALQKYASEFIVIANPDIVIDEMMFIKLLETFDENLNISMCAPVAKDLKGNYCIAMQRLPNFSDDLRACFNSFSKVTLSENNLEYFDSKRTMLKTEMIVGCFFIIKADDFMKVGLLDENTFLFCEERILGKKLKDAGMKMTIRTDLFFTHAHSNSIGKTYKIVNIWKLIYKSRLYYEKHYNHCSCWKLIVLRGAIFFAIEVLTIKLSLYNMISRN